MVGTAEALVFRYLPGSLYKGAAEALADFSYGALIGQLLVCLARHWYGIYRTVL